MAVFQPEMRKIFLQVGGKRVPVHASGPIFNVYKILLRMNTLFKRFRPGIYTGLEVESVFLIYFNELAACTLVKSYVECDKFLLKKKSEQNAIWANRKNKIEKRQKIENTNNRSYKKAFVLFWQYYSDFIGSH